MHFAAAFHLAIGSLAFPAIRSGCARCCNLDDVVAVVAIVAIAVAHSLAKIKKSPVRRVFITLLLQHTKWATIDRRERGIQKRGDPRGSQKGRQMGGEKDERFVYRKVENYYLCCS